MKFKQYLNEEYKWDFEEAVEDGLNTEYEEIAKQLFQYWHNNKKSGLFNALKNEDYEAYLQQLGFILKKEYPSRKIKVRRYVGYAGGSGEGVGDYVSVSTNPHWGDKKQNVKEYVINIKDVVAVGHVGEGELIVKKSALNSSKIIKEEYYGSVKDAMALDKWKGGYTEVFKNPTLKEIRDIIKDSGIKSIRFFIDFVKKDIYCWKADTIHNEVNNLLLKNDVYLEWKNHIRGSALIKDGKLRLENVSDWYDNKKTIYMDGILGRFHKANVSWLKSYFDDLSIKYMTDNLMLKEEYLTTTPNIWANVKNAPNYFEVFKNPTQKEMIDAIHAEDKKNIRLRFIADYPNKVLYIMPVDALHNDTIKDILKDSPVNYLIPSPDVVWGQADYDNGKLNFYWADTMPPNMSDRYFKKWYNKDDWTEKYFNDKLSIQIAKIYKKRIKK
jgi:hypothetical protein